MKKKIKRFIPALFVLLLLAGTIACAKDYNYYMSPGYITYTEAVTKGNTSKYTWFDTEGTDKIYVRYTVTNSGLTALTNTAKINGSMYIRETYKQTMSATSQVRLKVENNTTDNSGRYVTAKGTWTP